MGQVAMMGIVLLEVVHPLLQLAPLAYLIGKELVQLRLQFLLQVGVDTQQTGSCQRAGEVLADDGHVHRGPHAEGYPFTLGRDEPVLG